MPRFKVYRTEHICDSVEVEAESSEEAQEIAQDDFALLWRAEYEDAEYEVEEGWNGD